LYLFPAGNDTWSGTLAEPNRDGTDGPWATVRRAQQAVRERNAAGSTTAVTVLVREGVYPQREPLVFTPEDAGTPDGPVTFAAYPGERPVISGGLPITGWERDGQGTKPMTMKTTLLTWLGTAALLLSAGLAPAAEPAQTLNDAVALWHFRETCDSAGQNSRLEPQGDVELGQTCDAGARAASLARGGDGVTAECSGGFLVAGQGAGDELNLTGAALSLYARLQDPSGDWSSCGIVSKHGGHDQLTYNLYASGGKLGFELGTEQGLFRVDVPVQSIGATDWHDVVVRYDGNNLELWVDGLLAAERPAAGKLRAGNRQPLVLAGYTLVGKLRGPFEGRLDTVALWQRALDQTEIVALSGGKAEAEGRRQARLAAQYEGLPQPVADYRRVVRSSDVETYSRAALALRKWMIENDPHRPIYHFTGPESWINDPNGPIYYRGRYHLFYQFDPQVPDGKGGWKRSKRCWGHAVSDDLVHWVDWPVASWPDTQYDCGGVYSGNTFVDDGGHLCGLYTGNVSGRGGLRYGVLLRSRDGGVTWDKEMVMDHSQRPNDQSPVHHDGYTWKEADTWYQLIGGATGGPDAQGAAWLWTSKDLERWTLQKNIAPSIKLGRFWELPYLIELGGRHVVLVGHGNPYWVGSYDRETMLFTPDRLEPKSIDNGTYYSFNVNMTDDKGPGGTRRQLMHGWVQGPGSPTKTVPYWQSAHSIPRVLTLHGEHVVQQPIPEIEVLRAEHRQFGPVRVEPGGSGYLSEVEGDALEIIARFDPAGTTATRLGLRVREGSQESRAARVWYDPETRQFGCDGGVIKKAAAEGRLMSKDSAEPEGPIVLRIFVDRSVLEVYCGGAAMTNRMFPDPDALGVDMFAEGGVAEVHSVDVWRMRSMWEK